MKSLRNLFHLRKGSVSLNSLCYPSLVRSGVPSFQTDSLLLNSKRFGTSIPHQHDETKTSSTKKSTFLMDTLLYLSAGTLIVGSIYYASDFLQNLDRKRKYGDQVDSNSKSEFLQPVSSSSFFSAMLFNWCVYPKEVRKPLRAALLHHTFAPFSDSKKQAEAFYLLAYDAGLKKNIDLSILAGIAYKLAQLYEELELPSSSSSSSSPSSSSSSSSLSTPIFNWYQKALHHLIGWHLNQSNRISIPELETLVSLLDSLAYYAPSQSKEALYSMAFSLSLAPTLPSDPTHLDTVKLKPMLEHVLNQTIPPFPNTTTSMKPTVSVSTLTNLLEHFASYYDTQHQFQYALQLRSYLLSTTPNIDSDPFCRRAHVLLNLASTHVQLQTQQDYFKAYHYLKTAEPLCLVVPLTNECRTCYFALTQNLGHVAEFLGHQKEAMEYFERALSMARETGEVEIRREIQSNLARLRSSLSSSSSSSSSSPPPKST